MSSEKQRHPRAPAKGAPFSVPRSRQQRSAMTATLRKAKRGHTVAKKRHMDLPLPPSPTQQQQGNPYGTHAMHAKKAIEVATSIVQLSCTPGEGDRSPSSLSPLLEQLCTLVTPSGTSGKMPAATGPMTIGAPGRSPPAGASYDSSAAGMAANALLAQFFEGAPVQTRRQGHTNNLAFLLADALAKVLSATTTDTTHVATNQSMQIKATVALNQLAATEPPPPFESSFDQEQFSPYGHPPRSLCSDLTASIPTSWCHAIVQSDALPGVVRHLPPLAPRNNAGDLDLCARCVWVVGNLAGGSQMAREELRHMGALPRLIGAVSTLMQHPKNDPSFVDLIRTSVWALINLFRGGGIPAEHFLGVPETPHLIMSKQLQGDRLTPRDLARLLSSPEEFSSATWKGVAVETCWLLSFFTRDMMAVEYLCGDKGRAGKSDLISLLVFRLVRATDEISQQLDSASNIVVQDEGCLIPCCRALKNAAIFSNGRYSILLPQTDGASHSAVESSIAKLISLGTLGAGSDVSSIATEAAALTGACLRSAGSTPACRKLLPALCRALTSPLSTFDFKRELVWALWDAVDFPLEQCETAQDVTAVQTNLLADIVQTSPSEIARALMAMMATLDVDVLDASLGLVDILLRRLDPASRRLATIFEEAGVVEALWRVCDAEESAAAELAAGLLDDFYDPDQDADGSPTPLAEFQFQVQPMPEGGFNFGADAPLRQGCAPPPMGRGRGRDNNLPAWMQR